MRESEYDFKVDLSEWDSGGRKCSIELTDHPYIELIDLLKEADNRVEKAGSDNWILEKRYGNSKIVWLSDTVPEKLYAILRIKPAWPVQIKAAIIVSTMALIGTALGMVNGTFFVPNKGADSSPLNNAKPNYRDVGERGKLPNNLNKLYQFSASRSDKNEG